MKPFGEPMANHFSYQSGHTMYWDCADKWISFYFDWRLKSKLYPVLADRISVRLYQRLHQQAINNILILSYERENDAKRV